MAERSVRNDQLPKDAGTAAEVIPQLAASTIVLRNEPFEVLLMRRVDTSTFVPGAWVFPGGSVDASDREIARRLGGADDIAAAKVCAVRELLEESGIWLGDDTPDVTELRERLSHQPDLLTTVPEHSIRAAIAKLTLTARWITPAGVPKRYDTPFFLVEVPADTTATADEVEGAEVAWLGPDEALQRHRDGSLPMVFPTIRNLEALVGFTTAAALIESRKNAVIRTIQPVLVADEKGKRLIIPDFE